MNVDPAGALAPFEAVASRRAAARPACARIGSAASLRRLSRRTAAGLLLGVGTLVLSHPAWSQSSPTDPREMTVEELETFIAEQKAALEIVRENRDITAEKAREVKAALEAKEAEREAAEAELEALCEERESLEPGTFDECMATLGED